MERPGGVCVSAPLHDMNPPHKKSLKPSKSTTKPGKRPRRRNKEKPEERKKKPSLGHWEADERLDDLACKAMVDFLRRAEFDELTAFRFISLLNDLAACTCKGGESFEAVAPYVLEWPVPLNPRKEYAKERKETMAMIRNLKVASRHPLRNRKTLRGGLGDKVEHYVVLLSHGFPGLPFLPPLNPSNLLEYREKAWELFVRDYGERFEGHPAMKSIAPEKLQGQPVSPGKRRDIIRDAWEGAWKTIARQVASQK